MKMHHHKKLLLFILQATLLSIQFPCFLSQTTIAINPSKPSSCNDGPFRCGSIRYLTYPFWGGDRPLNCGRPDSQLVCNNNVPMLNISPLSYRVQLIDFDTNTLTVAREDLWNNTCPHVFHNTTIDSDFFRYSPESNDQIVTLFFDCTSSDRRTLPNQFRCDGDDSNTTNLFQIGSPSYGPGFGITCSKNIFVQINTGAAESLKDPTASSINILQTALATGFSIKWQEDELQHKAPFCNANVYGSCIARSSNQIRNCSSGNNCRRPDSGGRPGQGPSPSASASPSGNVPSPAPAYATAPAIAPDGSYYQRRYDPRNSSPPTRIILGIILGIIGVVVVSITIYCSLKKRNLVGSPDERSNQDIENILLQHGLQAPKRYKYSQIKKITKSFNDKLGQGAYGSVYKGTLPDGCLVAVKVLMETGSDGEEFINEVASISRTSHVNIVNLLGFCYDRNKKALVYEFMPNKSLDKFISSNAHYRLDMEKLYKIALGVAKGLEYLHTGCNTRIVHFDIKPQNILLDEDFCPKISDFGLAKLCKKKQSILSMLGARGTIGYIAPEIFSRNFGAVSHKSDVYSYGMMVLQMAGAKNIVETEATQSSENYFPDKIYDEVILDVTRKVDDFNIEEDDDGTRKMLLVGFWCIQTTPSDRPSMSKVAEMLEGSLQSIRIPPKPFLFCPRLTGQEFSQSLPTHAEAENLAPG